MYLITSLFALDNFSEHPLSLGVFFFDSSDVVELVVNVNRLVDSFHCIRNVMLIDSNVTKF